MLIPFQTGVEKQNRRKRIKKKEVERRGEKKGERRGESGGVSLIIRFQTGVEKQNQTMNHVESERVTGFNGKTRAIVFSLKVI